MHSFSHDKENTISFFQNHLYLHENPFFYSLLTRVSNDRVWGVVALNAYSRCRFKAIIQKIFFRHWVSNHYVLNEIKGYILLHYWTMNKKCLLITKWVIHFIFDNFLFQKTKLLIENNCNRYKVIIFVFLNNFGM